jgi:hypothetical protein
VACPKLLTGATHPARIATATVVSYSDVAKWESKRGPTWEGADADERTRREGT